MNKILATIIAFFLYHANHTLQFLAEIFASDRLDHLSIRYSNWYNRYLIGAIINFSYTKNSKKYAVSITESETIDTLLIATVTYKGLTLAQLEDHILRSLSTIVGVGKQSIQITSVSNHQVKVVFPMKNTGS